MSNKGKTYLSTSLFGKKEEGKPKTPVITEQRKKHLSSNLMGRDTDLPKQVVVSEKKKALFASDTLQGGLDK